MSRLLSIFGRPSGGFVDNGKLSALELLVASFSPEGGLMTFTQNLKIDAGHVLLLDKSPTIKGALDTLAIIKPLWVEEGTFPALVKKFTSPDATKWNLAWMLIDPQMPACTEAKQRNNYLRAMRFLTQISLIWRKVKYRLLQDDHLVGFGSHKYTLRLAHRQHVHRSWWLPENHRLFRRVLMERYERINEYLLSDIGISNEQFNRLSGLELFATMSTEEMIVALRSFCHKESIDPLDAAQAWLLHMEKCNIFELLKDYSLMNIFKHYADDSYEHEVSQIKTMTKSRTPFPRFTDAKRMVECLLKLRRRDDSAAVRSSYTTFYPDVYHQETELVSDRESELVCDRETEEVRNWIAEHICDQKSEDDRDRSREYICDWPIQLARFRRQPPQQRPVPIFLIADDDDNLQASSVASGPSATGQLPASEASRLSALAPEFVMPRLHDQRPPQERWHQVLPIPSAHRNDHYLQRQTSFFASESSAMAVSRQFPASESLAARKFAHDASGLAP